MHSDHIFYFIFSPSDFDDYKAAFTTTNYLQSNTAAQTRGLRHFRLKRSEFKRHKRLLD